ncbi:hypothetical protein [Geodermatophilus amargosae]|uniref:hypothetical protein n=1 Tax=Geodermatophilus amargosae TaxID=1296565 RepID=UPI0034DF99DD
MPLILDLPPPPRLLQEAVTVPAAVTVHAAVTGERVPVRGVPAGRSWDALARRPAAGPGTPGTDLVEEWGLQSFPASDPPSNW